MYLHTTHLKDKWVQWKIPSKVDISNANMMPIDRTKKLILLKSYEFPEMILKKKNLGGFITVLFFLLEKKVFEKKK